MATKGNGDPGGQPKRRLSALDRAIEQAMGSGRKVGREDDPAQQSHPNLWEWLSRIYIGEDRMMQPASLTVQLGPEGVLVRISSRDLQSSVSVSCPYLKDILDAIESELSRDNPNIQSWGKSEPKLRKRKSGN